MPLEHIRSNNTGLGNELKALSQAARQLRERAKTVLGIMNDCFVDSGDVATNNYGELEAVFGITANNGVTVGNTASGYKAWYKVATLNDAINASAAIFDAAANDLA